MDIALGVKQEPPVCRRDLREGLESIAPFLNEIERHYGVVRAHLEKFLTEAQRRGGGDSVPSFVERRGRRCSAMRTITTPQPV